MRFVLFMLLSLLIGSTVHADLEEFFDGDAIPEVLTATRLKQPKTETPASVTVIEAEQIQAWGARSIPEVLRFVPGMFVGHSQNESTDTVVYHASTQNFMRRLQVLVDGRSVYKASISRVIWDDVPVAVEDIARIEVIRGPSSASYGANAFLATINIITKAPEDTLGTRLSYRGGSKGIQDGFASYSTLLGTGSLRLSTSYNADHGFDGMNAGHGKDNWRDDSRNKFANLTYFNALDARTQLKLYGSVGNSYAQLDQTDVTYPDYNEFRDTDFKVLHGQLEFDFSPKHRSRLQVYWQKEQRVHERHDEVSAVFFDPALRALYGSNPAATHALIQLAPGLLAANDPAAALQDFATTHLTPADMPNFGALVSNIQTNGANVLAPVTGFIDYNYTDQRTDIEWQDTVIWHERLRSVSGVSYRLDEAWSSSMFGGYRSNETYRAFANFEGRPLDFMLLNLGGMYEYEELNGAAFSPRAAINFLTGEQQSVRLVYSQAIRSPDMFEQQPNMSLLGQDLSPSYLSSQYTHNTMEYFLTKKYDENLPHERIKSMELGFYQMLAALHLELDVKLYHERLSRLSPGTVSVETYAAGPTTGFHMHGAELQLKWQPLTSDWLWLSLSKLNFSHLDDIGRPETRISPEYSAVTSWHHQGQRWNSTLSHFWLDGFSNNKNLYHRLEWTLRKEWRIGGYTPWIGGQWQHQFSRAALGHRSQRYSNANLYYLQLGMNF